MLVVDWHDTNVSHTLEGYSYSGASTYNSNQPHFFRELASPHFCFPHKKVLVAISWVRPKHLTLESAGPRNHKWLKLWCYTQFYFGMSYVSRLDTLFHLALYLVFFFFLPFSKWPLDGQKFACWDPIVAHVGDGHRSWESWDVAHQFRTWTMAHVGVP